jgi:Tol biopolymer transport system component
VIAIGRRVLVLLAAATVVACELTPVESEGRAGAAPSATTVAGFPGVTIHPLGNVKGDFVFAARIVDGANGEPIGTNELWAIPTATAAPARVVLSYPRDDIAEAWPTRYVSPDGRRYAFQIDRGDGVHRIMIADLLTGSLSWLHTDNSQTHDGQPVWDPTGKRIAFNRLEGGLGGRHSGGVWVVNADGTGLKQLARGTDAPTYIYHWTPDGRWVAFAQNVGYDFVDASTGARVDMDKVVSGDASWRTGSPRLIAHGWESAAGGDLQYIFTADAPGGERTVLVRAGSTSDSVNTPRWRPGTDEFLYGHYVSGKADIRIRSLSGSERTLPLQEMGSPAWSPDGASIAYIGGTELTPIPGPDGTVVNTAFALTEIRVIGADGQGDRLLYRLTTADGKPGWCVCNDGLTIRRY